MTSAFSYNEKIKEYSKFIHTSLKNLRKLREKFDDKTTNGIQSYTLVFDQLQNTFLVYNQEGKFMSTQNIGDSILNSFQLLDIIPSTGLLIKYDPSIPIIYLGFLFLMITTLLSYLPYTQIWVVNQSKNFWIGATTNRGKIQLEIEFENFIRYIEKKFQAI